jgi:hypothetical protein
MLKVLEVMSIGKYTDNGYVVTSDIYDCATALQSHVITLSVASGITLIECTIVCR